jgi:hypothetical protein
MEQYHDSSVQLPDQSNLGGIRFSCGPRIIALILGWLFMNGYLLGMDPMKIRRLLVLERNG